MTYDQAIAIPGAFYVMTMKSGAYFVLSSSGGILYDSGRDCARADDGQWNVVGIGRRWNSRDLYGLDTCAREGKRAIGHGFVHDRDHGTRRMWGMPTNRRAVSVEVIERKG